MYLPPSQTVADTHAHTLTTYTHRQTHYRHAHTHTNHGRSPQTYTHTYTHHAQHTYTHHAHTHTRHIPTHTHTTQSHTHRYTHTHTRRQKAVMTFLPPKLVQNNVQLKRLEKTWRETDRLLRARALGAPPRHGSVVGNDTDTLAERWSEKLLTSANCLQRPQGR